MLKARPLVFFPAAAEIDWSRGYVFLDKELQQIVRDAELGKRLADKLVQVWKKDGNDVWVLAHVEVQGQERSDFAKRMFVYNYRIFDRYNRPVASLAVLSDERTGWRPDHFGYELWGCRVGISFPVAKVVDYANRWNELEASDNPFAIEVMAHLKTRDTHNDKKSRKRWKLYLVRWLYERGYRRKDVINLFHFFRDKVKEHYPVYPVDSVGYQLKAEHFPPFWLYGNFTIKRNLRG